MNILEQKQLKNAVEQILHVPGNDTGGVLEMALVLDYGMPEEALRRRAAEVADCLKKHSEVFRNVRVNVLKWVDDGTIRKEVQPLSFVQTGMIFRDYNSSSPFRDCDTCLGRHETQGEQRTKTLEELVRQLKLFYARSKLILLVTDGEYTLGDEAALKEHLHPFVHRKLLVLQSGELLRGRDFL